MKSHVIVFPGSNCDRDIAVSIKNISGNAPEMIWHKETSIDTSDLIVVPGGFSYGDYLRCGAIASTSPIMNDVIKKAKVYENLETSHSGKFHYADSLKKAKIIDLLQELFENGTDMEAVHLEGKWCEIDTPQDLELARKLFE